MVLESRFPKARRSGFGNYLLHSGNLFYGLRAIPASFRQGVPQQVRHEVNICLMEHGFVATGKSVNLQPAARVVPARVKVPVASSRPITGLKKDNPARV